MTIKNFMAKAKEIEKNLTPVAEAAVEMMFHKFVSFRNACRLLTSVGLVSETAQLSSV